MTTDARRRRDRPLDHRPRPQPRACDVVAEGVEDPLTLLRLGTLGCDLAQGFHISPPLPEHRFREWLDHRREEMSRAVPADEEPILDGR